MSSQPNAAPAVPLTDAAHSLHLPYLTMRDLVLRGAIRGFKQSGHWWVDADALRAYGTSNTTSAVADSRGGAR